MELRRHDRGRGTLPGPASGEHLHADIVMTATGLVLKLMSGLQLTVDGAPVDLSQTITYKGMMSERCPEHCLTVRLHKRVLDVEVRPHGRVRLPSPETHGSWIIDQHGYAQRTPRLNDPELTAVPAIDFNSGYALRPLHTLPRQGSKTPWRLHQNYVKDLSMLRFGRVDDGTMEFKAAPGERNGDAVLAQHG